MKSKRTNLKRTITTHECDSGKFKKNQNQNQLLIKKLKKNSLLNKKGYGKSGAQPHLFHGAEAYALQYSTKVASATTTAQKQGCTPFTAGRGRAKPHDPQKRFKTLLNKPIEAPNAGGSGVRQYGSLYLSSYIRNQ